jgi:single-stranded DNA-binding protein
VPSTCPRAPARRLLRVADQSVQALQEGSSTPDAHVSFAGNLTDQPELRHTEGGITRATLRVAVSGRREQEPSFFTVVVGRLQQRTWTAEDGNARQAVEVVAEELGPSLRWATATPVRATGEPASPSDRSTPA